MQEILEILAPEVGVDLEEVVVHSAEVMEAGLGPDVVEISLLIM